MWRQMPDRVAITYREQTTPGVYTSSTVYDCWWRPQGQSEGGPSQGVYTRAYRDWYMPLERRSTPPEIGDVIVSPVSGIDPVSSSWTVLSVTQAGALGAWQCGTVCLALQAGLRQTCSVERPTNAQDSAYRASLATYTSVASGVSCRLQPQDGNANDVAGRVTIPRRYTLYLGQRVEVRAKDVVIVSGVRYTVVASLTPDQLTDLQTCDLELLE